LIRWEEPTIDSRLATVLTRCQLERLVGSTARWAGQAFTAATGSD